MENYSPKLPSGAEITLQNLGTRYATGAKLSGVDIGMATLASAQLNAQRFGPGPANMKVTGETVPENVKGVLAQFAT